jgi:hypothetical protein
MGAANPLALDRLILLAKGADAARLEELLPVGADPDGWNMEVDVAALTDFIQESPAGAAAATALAAVAVAGSDPETNGGMRVSLGWLLLLFTMTYPDDATVPGLVKECVPEADVYVQWVIDALMDSRKSTQPE